MATTLSNVDVVFPVLHGPFGEDGTVQGLLELAGVPYVGAGVLASALCMDKDVFKAVLRDHGIPVTENITLRLGDEPRNPFGYPCFVKPARLGSSVGITKAHDDDELRRGVALAFEHDEKVLVERFVTGVEVEVGVLGNLTPFASLPGEIVVTHNEWYDFEAKYDEGEMDLDRPCAHLEAQLERAQELAVRAFVATDCEGMARADLFVREDGEVLVNELNTIPGFTSTSVYARLFEASGIPYPSSCSSSPTSRWSGSRGADALVLGSQPRTGTARVPGTCLAPMDSASLMPRTRIQTADPPDLDDAVDARIENGDFSNTRALRSSLRRVDSTCAG